jgi:hypothetical protein
MIVISYYTQNTGGVMEGYTIRVSDELRSAIDKQAAKEPRVSSADMARRWLEIGREVQEAGFATLAEFCAAQRNETLDDWTGEDDG